MYPWFRESKNKRGGEIFGNWPTEIYRYISVILFTYTLYRIYSHARVRVRIELANSSADIAYYLFIIVHLDLYNIQRYRSWGWSSYLKGDRDRKNEGEGIDGGICNSKQAREFWEKVRRGADRNFTRDKTDIYQIQCTFYQNCRTLVNLSLRCADSRGDVFTGYEINFMSGQILWTSCTSPLQGEILNRETNLKQISLGEMYVIIREIV